MSISMATVVYSEEATISELLTQAREYAQEIIVLDCSSTDRTKEIAENLAARVINRPYTGSSGVGGNKQEAINQAKCPWLLILDGDELLDEELLETIQSGTLFKNQKVRGWWFRRKWLIDGLLFNYFGEDWQLRLLRRETAKWSDGVHITPNIELTEKCYHGWILHRVDSERLFKRYEIYSKLEPSDEPFNTSVVNTIKEFLKKKR